MPETPTSDGIDEPTWTAVLRIMDVARNMSAQATFYTLALAAIGLAPETGLSALLVGLGANAISRIVERLAFGDDQMTGDEIRGAIVRAIVDTQIDSLLTQDEFGHALARLARWHDIIRYTIKDCRYDILEQIAEQSRQNEILYTSLHFTVVTGIDQLGERMDEVKALLKAWSPEPSYPSEHMPLEEMLAGDLLRCLREWKALHSAVQNLFVSTVRLESEYVLTSQISHEVTSRTKRYWRRHCKAKVDTARQPAETLKRVRIPLIDELRTCLDTESRMHIGRLIRRMDTRKPKSLQRVGSSLEQLNGTLEEALRLADTYIVSISNELERKVTPGTTNP